MVRFVLQSVSSIISRLCTRNEWPVSGLRLQHLNKVMNVSYGPVATVTPRGRKV